MTIDFPEHPIGPFLPSPWWLFWRPPFRRLHWRWTFDWNGCACEWRWQYSYFDFSALDRAINHAAKYETGMKWPDTERRAYGADVETAVGLMDAHVRIDNLNRLLLRTIALAESKHWRDRAGLNLASHPLWDDVRAAINHAAKQGGP